MGDAQLSVRFGLAGVPALESRLMTALHSSSRSSTAAYLPPSYTCTASRNARPAPQLSNALPSFLGKLHDSCEEHIEKPTGHQTRKAPALLFSRLPMAFRNLLSRSSLSAFYSVHVQAAARPCAARTVQFGRCAPHEDGQLHGSTAVFGSDGRKLTMRTSYLVAVSTMSVLPSQTLGPIIASVWRFKEGSGQYPDGHSTVGDLV
eukprot:1353547-Rhodomonas_salina.3